jgi:hypothetical protein
MTVTGIVSNGVIVLDQPGGLPEGARGEIVVEQRQPAGETLRDLLLRFAGTFTGLPSDMAEQHDHYIHGTPKK